MVIIPYFEVMAIRMILAEDHDGFRESIRTLLNDKQNFRIVNETIDGLATVQSAKELKPDVILMDISLPKLNGMAATYLIKEYDSHIRLLGLTMHTELNFVIGMFKAGASGYVLKDTVVRELKQAILMVMKDQIYLSKKIEKEMFQSYLKKMIDGKYRTEQNLSEHEMKVLEKLANGQSLETIGISLNIELKTVEMIHQKILQSWITYVKLLNMQDMGYPQ